MPATTRNPNPIKPLPPHTVPAIAIKPNDDNTAAIGNNNAASIAPARANKLMHPSEVMYPNQIDHTGRSAAARGQNDPSRASPIRAAIAVSINTRGTQ